MDWKTRSQLRWLVFATLGCAGDPVEGTGAVDADTDAAGDSVGVSASADEATEGHDEAEASDDAADCGNGIVDPAEECDEGPGNANDGACTVDCMHATCGDGHVRRGIEACDDGNADDTDGCTSACIATACDDGLLNGAETGIDCGGPSCAGCEFGEACTLGSDCGSALCVDGTCSYATSCKQLHELAPELGSDEYWIDVDGDGRDPMIVACDMLTAGGGWTSIATIANDGVRNWDDVDAFIGAEPFGTLRPGRSPADYKSLAYSRLVADDLLLRTEDYAVGWTALLGLASFSTWLADRYDENACSEAFVAGTPDISESLDDALVPLFDLVVRPKDTNATCFPLQNENAILGVVFPSCCWTYGLGNTPAGDAQWSTHDNSMPRLDALLATACEGGYPCNPAGWVHGGTTCYDESCKTVKTEIWVR